MRPIGGSNDLQAITAEGAYFPGGNKLGGCGVDQLASTKPYPVLGVELSLAGSGPAPAYGTFIDQGSWKYGFVRYFKTTPQLVIQLRNEQFGPLQKSVTAPMTLKKQPGYSDDVPYASTAISRMVGKPYEGAPVQ